MHFLFPNHPILNQHDFGRQVKKNISFSWQTTNNKQAPKSANSLAHDRAFANFSEPVSWRRYNSIRKTFSSLWMLVPRSMVIYLPEKVQCNSKFHPDQRGFLAALKPNSNSVHWHWHWHWHWHTHTHFYMCRVYFWWYWNIGYPSSHGSVQQGGWVRETSHRGVTRRGNYPKTAQGSGLVN